MGQNDSYTSTRSQIFLMAPLPFVNQAYPMLFHEESQRSMASSINTNTPLDSTALYTSGKGNKSKKNWREIARALYIPQKKNGVLVLHTTFLSLLFHQVNFLNKLRGSTSSNCREKGGKEILFRVWNFLLLLLVELHLFSLFNSLIIT